VAGKTVSWAEAEKLFAETARTQSVEFRDEQGQVIATTVPGSEPLVPWDPTITQEEIERRLAGEFVTFDEMKKRLGWE
jgi:hypothetical protein